MTYDELRNLEARLEDTYRNHGQHPESTFSVDAGVLTSHVNHDGWHHWRSVYLERRAHGLAHEAAMRAIESDIDTIEGRPDRWAAPSPNPLPPEHSPPSGDRPLPPLQGALRIEAGAFADDTGPVLPVFYHHGDAFSLYLRDPDRVRRDLDLAASVGYQGCRFWTVLGGPYWSGREVNCATNPHEFEQFGRELKARDLRAMMSQGDLWRPSAGASRASVRQTIFDYFDPTVIAFIDAGNEAINDARDTNPGKMSEWLLDLPGLKTLTSPPSEEKGDLDACSIWPADCYDVHGYRGGHWWDKVRHVVSMALEIRPKKRLGIQSEPFGPGQRVSVTDNKHELTEDVMLMGAVASMIARQTWVMFAGPGVISDEAEHFRDMPGFMTTPSIVAKLPRDLMRYEHIVHGGASQRGKRVFGVTDSPGAETMRCDHAISDAGRFVCLAYGPNLSDHVQERGQVEWTHSFGNQGKLYIGRT